MPLTSPSNRSSLKLRLLILSCGDPGKQQRQLVRLERRFMKSWAILTISIRRRGTVRLTVQSFSIGTKHWIESTTA